MPVRFCCDDIEADASCPAEGNLVNKFRMAMSRPGPLAVVGEAFAVNGDDHDIVGRLPGDLGGEIIVDEPVHPYRGVGKREIEPKNKEKGRENRPPPPGVAGKSRLHRAANARKTRAEPITVRMLGGGSTSVTDWGGVNGPAPPSSVTTATRIW